MVDAVHCTYLWKCIEQVRPHESELRPVEECSEVAVPARAEIVDAGDCTAGSHKRFAEIRANKTGAAGDEGMFGAVHQ
jgi:hypothetical protein